MTGRPGRPHHQGTYARRAKVVRNAAWADPTTTCWRCHLTLAQYAALHGAQAAAWQAGHLRDSDRSSPLVAEHARCNASAGATLGNQLRRGPIASRQW